MTSISKWLRDDSRRNCINECPWYWYTWVYTGGYLGKYCQGSSDMAMTTAYEGQDHPADGGWKDWVSVRLVLHLQDAATNCCCPAVTSTRPAVETPFLRSGYCRVLTPVSGVYGKRCDREIVEHWKSGWGPLPTQESQPLVLLYILSSMSKHVPDP